MTGWAAIEPPRKTHHAEPTPEAWAQIRYAYENTDQPLAHICADHGITVPMLRYRMKRWEWKRRKPLIPREGPPAVASDFVREPVHPTPPGFAGAQPADPPPPGQGEEPAAIVPRLQNAIARILQAIEATIARLAAGPYRPCEMEQAGRALSSLTRTLRELNALLSQHRAADDDPPPMNIDEFRQELSRRLQGIIAARKQRIEEAKRGET